MGDLGLAHIDSVVMIFQNEMRLFPEWMNPIALAPH